MSSLAWIDFDEAERQRAERIMALFQERESRDELGLGAIRDSIADHLFPGTSTIQTRLRYMLFVPWLFRMLEDRNAGEAQIRTEARNLEVRLAEALKAGGETNGVIGRDAGPRLQRLPSSVYWAGLGSWGIRNFLGSIDSLFVTLQGRKRQRGTNEDEQANAKSSQIWIATLPSAPSDLLRSAAFQLTKDEADFLKDRLVMAQPASLLTFLAREGIHAESDEIWHHPNVGDFPPKIRSLVRYAEVFSLVMHGAALLYNLCLSELRNRDDWIEDYGARLHAWADEVSSFPMSDWALSDFWASTQHPAHRVQPAARRFVTEWLELVASGPHTLAAAPAARRLVEDRERRLKTSQSRYENTAVRDRWGGASGANRLGFRWSQTSSHIQDLANAT